MMLRPRYPCILQSSLFQALRSILIYTPKAKTLPLSLFRRELFSAPLRIGQSSVPLATSCKICRLQRLYSQNSRHFCCKTRKIEPVKQSFETSDHVFNQSETEPESFHDSFSGTAKYVHGHKYLYRISKDGYLTINDLVKFLKFEGAMDICVVKTSGARTAYVDYFVVVSGMSIRHLRAMAKNLEQLFRGLETRAIGRHGHVTIEGLESDHWLAVDIGSIVVHFFLPEMRELYELEKLWTLGPNYDDQYKAMAEEDQFLQAVYLGKANNTEQKTKVWVRSDSVNFY